MSWRHGSITSSFRYTPTPPCLGTTLRKNRPLVPRSNSRTTFFLPRYWVFHGSGGCRTAIQVCRTTFHDDAVPKHFNIPEPKPKPKPKPAPAPKPNAAPKPGPKGLGTLNPRFVAWPLELSVTPPTDHGSMSRLMFGLTKATRPPCKMRQRMRQNCVCCVARSAPPLQFVMSVRSTIVLNVLTPTLLGPMLFVKYNTNDSWSC